eukprot:2028814-Alexandrium_andersonii.AAC.1
MSREGCSVSAVGCDPIPDPPEPTSDPISDTSRSRYRRSGLHSTPPGSSLSKMQLFGFGVEVQLSCVGR